MLLNAVHPVQELRAVKTQADQHKTQSGTDVTYDQYVRLLLSAASTYYAQFTTKTPFAARTPRHAVYSHDVAGSNDGDDSDYDIDSKLDIIQAYGHSTGPPGTSMALNQWTQLSQDTMDIRDILPDPAYDIDCALDIIQANGRPPGTSSMALSQWTQFLSQDAKDIWDSKLPDEAKDILELESIKMSD
jgi:hypothetical protein